MHFVGDGRAFHPPRHLGERRWRLGHHNALTVTSGSWPFAEGAVTVDEGYALPFVPWTGCAALGLSIGESEATRASGAAVESVIDDGLLRGCQWRGGIVRIESVRLNGLLHPSAFRRATYVVYIGR